MAGPRRHYLWRFDHVLASHTFLYVAETDPIMEQTNMVGNSSETCRGHMSSTGRTFRRTQISEDVPSEDVPGTAWDSLLLHFIADTTGSLLNCW